MNKKCQLCGCSSHDDNGTDYCNRCLTIYIKNIKRDMFFAGGCVGCLVMAILHIVSVIVGV